MFEPKLVGKWRTDPEESGAFTEYGDVSLDFSPNGTLTYTIHGDDKRQIILMTYRIEGDVLITDQPSNPKEETTIFRFTPSGKLVLMHEEGPSVYVRVDGSPVTPLPITSFN